MFFEAVARARQFTFPIIISTRMENGSCSSVVGTVVVLNDEGWFLTAAHIFQAAKDAEASLTQSRARKAEEAKINGDTSLDHKAKRKMLRNLGYFDPSKAVAQSSIWLVRDGLSIAEAYAVEPIDLAVGRLDPWDKNWVSVYPRIKDPSKDYDVGRSLCKLGYPFAQLNTTYDLASGSFRVEGVPPPLFPTDGILTRFENVIVTDQTGKVMPTPYPFRFVETSTPGLRGQSGGPTFDVNGDIWAIQSQTVTYPLNLEAPNIADRKVKEHIEHQFLNVGRGIHAESIIGLLKDRGIKFDLA